MRAALAGVAEELAALGAEGQADPRRKTAIGGALVVQMLQAERERAARAEREGGGRIEGIAAEVPPAPEAVRLLDHRVQPPRRALVQFIAEIDRAALLRVAAERDARAADVI